MSAAHEDDGHGHGGSPFTQHHYDDAQHQFDAGKFGIWLFLAQEVLFFSALFVAYVLYRYHHPEIYDYAHKYLDVKFGAINTAVLIFSSMTAAWAVRAAQLNQRKLLISCLALTLLCALTFLGIKYIEYSHKNEEQILMGKYFDPCLSSGGGPLLTKSNKCPGHNSSVWYEQKAAQTGCLAELAVDQRPNRPGLQVSCEVKMATVEVTRDPKTGDPVLDKERRWQFTEKSATPVPKRCAPHGAEGASYPCWQPSVQPAVCKPGYHFTMQCTPSYACSIEGDPFQVSGRFAKLEDCDLAAIARTAELKKRAEADKKAQLTEHGWIVNSCVRSNGVGFIVHRGDHSVLPKTYDDKGNILSQQLAIASCKPPPPPGVIDDVFAEPVLKTKLGAKQAGPPPQQASKDDFYLGPPPDNTNMFFTIYFAMTGLHGIHVLVGVFVFIWLLIRAIKGQFTPGYFGPVDFAALYWHIVDLIWIFLFPLLYLIH